MFLSSSTIFKRHETRNSERVQLTSIKLTTIKPIDTTFGETLANLISRSSIYGMHEQRQKVLNHKESPAPMRAASSYDNGLSLSSMATKSTIFKRNARRALVMSAKHRTTYY